MPDTCDSSEFINEIIRDANAGRSFVPFIGSGLSSPSGIIMGIEFTNYLAFTTYLVLCDPAERAKTHGEGKVRNWSLTQQGWPPAPSSHEVDRARQWIRTQFVQMCQRHELRAEYDGSDAKLVQSLTQLRSGSPLEKLLTAITQPAIPRIIKAQGVSTNDEELKQLAKLLYPKDPQKASHYLAEAFARTRSEGMSYQEQVVELGIRALADWRETLMFLSMVRVVDSDPSRLVMEESDSSIIDDFNATITRDRHPNLGHKILAHLSGPLRVSRLLSTNFDTLTEDAYRALSLPLRVLPVSTKGTLPPARTVAATDTLIKLHGETHDTRADLSLDEEPDAADKETFCQYMTRGTGHLLRRVAGSDGRYRNASSTRLLVVGYSGSDHRCVQMIRHWLEVTEDSPRVYWICFSPTDLTRVQELFASPRYRSRIKMVLSPRPDLVLYELYQRLVLSLPPGGLTYEFSHVLPPTRAPEFDSEASRVASVLTQTSGNAAAGSPLANFDARVLRDAAVMEIKQRILDAVAGKFQTFDDHEHSAFTSVRLWQPFYRYAEPPSLEQARRDLGELEFKPVVINGCGGVVRASALAAADVTTRQLKKVFWLELQDYVDGDSLLRDFLRTLSMRFGQFQSRHVTMHPLQAGMPQLGDADSFADWSREVGGESGTVARLVTHLKAVLRDYRTDAASLVVLLYGRDSYGNCSGIVSSSWNAPQPYHHLHLLIEVLGRVGIPTVYLPCTESRASRKYEAVSQMRGSVVSDGSSATSPPRDQQADAVWRHDQIWERTLTASDDNASFDRILESTVRSFSVFQRIMHDALAPVFEIDRLPGNAGLSFSVPAQPSRDWLRRLEFIYAISLFRHSRPPNSLCSEGGFPCPFRFRARAVDNDFVRAMEANLWIRELVDAGVFFSKPGGAVWMHRDVREAIRHVIDETTIPAIQRGGDDGPCESGSGASPRGQIRQHFSFRELRGRLHFWIGDWYFKAFCSSGHLTPVIESVHHLISAAIHSKDARPKRLHPGDELTEEEVRHRHMMFESAVSQATKVLLFSWDWLELWQASASEVGWLDQRSRLRVASQLNHTIRALNNGSFSGPHAKRLKQCRNEFLCMLRTMARVVKLEGGGTPRVTASQSSKASTIAALSRHPGFVRRPIVMDHGIDRIRVSEEELTNDITTAFRACGDAAASLWAQVLVVGDEHGARRSRGDDGADPIEALGKLKAKWKFEASSEAGVDAQRFHDLIWVMGEAAYILLRRAKLEFHGSPKRQISNRTWIKSTICCNLGIDLCKHLPPAMLDYEVQIKAKLHAIYALGLANLGRFYEASRHLNESQAMLSELSGGNARDIAIVSLRRAEVKLTECYWIARFIKISNEKTVDLSKPGWVEVRSSSPVETAQAYRFPDEHLGAVACWYSGNVSRRLAEGDREHPDAQMLPPGIFECFRTAKPPTLANDGSGQPEGTVSAQLDEWGEQSQSQLRRVFLSVLDEAVRALEVAEHNLAGTSQSSLWWSRLRVLQLRIYGQLVYLGDDAESCMILRKQSADTGIYFSFVAAARIAGEDEFRRLRALRYFLEANRWYTRFMDQPNRKHRLTELLPDSFQFARGLFRELQSKTKHYADEDLVKLSLAHLENEFDELHQ